MRRRTKPKVVWLPICNTNSIDPSNRSTWQRAAVALDGSVLGSSTTLEIPCVLDGLQSSPISDPNSSLADVENSGYRLRRIVGKIYVFISQNDRNNGETYGVTAGFIIRRTDSTAATSLAALSPGATATDDIENSMDPWIWRRSWILGRDALPDAVAPITQSAFVSSFNDFPHDNFGRNAGGVHEGPHVDQKTARIVGPEERLFLDLTATTLLDDPAAAGAPFLIVFTNLRVLGSMRTNIGNRRNASR